MTGAPDRDALLVSCEHGGNRIPSRYRALFSGHASLLHSHRGIDFGALRLARDMAAALDAPLLAATVSRLLVDLNRSPHHPRLWSEATRDAAPEVRDEILRHHYLPYRTRLESMVAQALATRPRVIHISCHSFTPELDGVLRNADIGLLYDPARPGETALCRDWRRQLAAHAPQLRVRMNYPYAGKADGFTTHLRRRFPAQSYVGIELEINQRHALEGGRHWQAMRAAVIAALAAALAASPSAA